MNDGGPVFPVPYPDAGSIADFGKPPGSTGLTLRDYFAGMALTGMIAKYGDEGSELAASICFRFADAMLAERDVVRADFSFAAECGRKAGEADRREDIEHAVATVWGDGP